MTDPRIEAAVDGIAHRMSWASIHWGDLRTDAYPHIAAAAISAADQACIITDQEQLDNVPTGSVLIDSYRAPLAGDVYQKDAKGTYWQAGPQGAFKTIQLPARVLHWGKNA